MATLHFELDSRELKVWRDAKVDLALSRALRLAGNQAARELVRGSTKHVKSRKLIREGDVQKGLVLTMPSRSTAIEDLEWVMRAAGRPLSLAKVPNVQTRKGVAVRVNVSGGKKEIASAFQARVSTGFKGVFVRAGKERYPIKALATSSIADPLRDPGAADAIHAAGLTRLQSAFERGLRRELDKIGR